MKKAVFWCALIVCSIVTPAVVGEMILRIMGHSGAPESSIGNIHYVEDSVVNWRYISRSEVKQGDVVMKYNSNGFRDVEHVAERFENIARIVVVGDSVTEGTGVKWESVFAHQIQNRLGLKHEVINIAMSGLNSPQVVHLFEMEGLKFQPELVIINFILNDCDFYSEFHAAQRFMQNKDSTIGILGLKVDPRIKGTLKSSALIYFLKNRLENLVGRVFGKTDSDYYAALWEKDENRVKVRDAFQKLHQIKNQKQFAVLIIIWPLLVDFSKYAYGAIHSWIENEALDNDFFVLDLLPKLAGISHRELQVTAEDTIHPNAYGHMVAAKAFIEWYNFLYKK